MKLSLRADLGVKNCFFGRRSRDFLYRPLISDRSRLTDDPVLTKFENEKEQYGEVKELEKMLSSAGQRFSWFTVSRRNLGDSSAV